VKQRLFLDGGPHDFVRAAVEHLRRAGLTGADFLRRLAAVRESSGSDG